METKKKSLAINAGFRNKKKMTAKKSKQIWLIHIFYLSKNVVAIHR